jgi:hypothetical protein
VSVQDAAIRCDRDDHDYIDVMVSRDVLRPIGRNLRTNVRRKDEVRRERAAREEHGATNERDANTAHEPTAMDHESDTEGNSQERAQSTHH